MWPVDGRFGVLGCLDETTFALPSRGAGVPLRWVEEVRSAVDESRLPLLQVLDMWQRSKTLPGGPGQLWTLHAKGAPYNILPEKSGWCLTCCRAGGRGGHNILSRDCTAYLRALGRYLVQLNKLENGQTN